MILDNPARVAERKRHDRHDEGRILDLENLLNEFFYLSLLENDNYEIKLQKIDILEILIDSLGEFYEVFENKGIEINADLVKNAYVLGDALSIKRVIDNLLKNLSKYCKRRADISLLKEDNTVEIVIVDYLEEGESIDTPMPPLPASSTTSSHSHAPAATHGSGSAVLPAPSCFAGLLPPLPAPSYSLPLQTSSSASFSACSPSSPSLHTLVFVVVTPGQ